MTTRNRIIRRAATLAAAGAVVALAGCSSTPAPTTTSTTSTPTYAQTINGGNDPAYTTGFTAVKSFLEAAVSDPKTLKIPQSATAFATPEFVASFQQSNDSLWASLKSLKGGPVARFEEVFTYPGWRGVVLNRNTQQMPWHMELGVCRTTTGTAYNSAGQVIASGPQTRLYRYTLKSTDQGKSWLVSEQQGVPSQVPQSKYDPSCTGNLNSSTSHSG